MSTLLLAIIVISLITIVTGVALASRPRLLLLVAPLCLVTLLCSFVLTTAALSYPKPVHLELENVAEAEVLWTGIEQGVSVKLLLKWGNSGPRLYTFPWSDDLANSVQKARQKSQATHRPLKVKRPFSGLKPTTEEGQPGEQGSGQGQPGSGSGSNRGGQGRGGKGNRASDNEGADMMFYSPPPDELPEKYGENGQDG